MWPQFGLRQDYYFSQIIKMGVCIGKESIYKELLDFVLVISLPLLPSYPPCLGQDV